MKYSKETLEAHQKRLKQYQDLIVFAEDKGNSLDAAMDKACDDLKSCTYCDAVNGQCHDCVVDYCCGDELQGSINARSKGTHRDQLIENLKLRHDHLALQAEFNMAEND